AQLEPTLEGLAKRFEHYAEVFAKKLGCRREDVEPCLYSAVCAVTNYMIFGDAYYISYQLEAVRARLHQLCLPDLEK
ncbi:MAG: hypothetical protein IJD22_04790, partial [Clostridia bacterium]|nr:hypothetical protein [Clostridia bacterium]